MLEDRHYSYFPGMSVATGCKFGRIFHIKKQMTEPPHYSRRVIISAADVLKELGHSGFDRFLLELGLEDPSIGRGGGLMARANSLAEFAIKNPQFTSPERRTIAYEIILRATELWNGPGDMNSVERKKFQAILKAEGLDHLLHASDPHREMYCAEANDFDTSMMPISSTVAVVEHEPNVMSENQARTPHPRRVFIVHGHDTGVQQAVARFLEKLDFEVIILHEQANMGKTVIEKFESNSDVGFVVVLLTPDDRGCKNGTEPRFRARQNVLLEWGYFIGRLGREHVCALQKGDLEMPSDIIGIVTEPFDEHGGWRMNLARELKAAGFEIAGDKLVQ